MNEDYKPPRSARVPGWLKPIVIAFGMFSRIPMPFVEWDGDSNALALVGFPLVGVVIGACATLWIWACAKLGASDIFRAAGLLIIPYCVAGGVHLDGFADTSDAIASHQPKARKLEIMKDSRVGAFAVIMLCLYLISQFAILCEIHFTGRQAFVIAMIPILTRILSAFTCVTFKSARDDGLMNAFASRAKTDAMRIMFAAWFALTACCAMALDWRTGGAVVAASLLSLLYYRRISYKEFGGVTGDLAGWFLQVTGWVCLLAVVIVQWM
jgi:adenosylcobinamide-GDP ribazoletransferase